MNKQKMEEKRERERERERERGTFVDYSVHQYPQPVLSRVLYGGDLQISIEYVRTINMQVSK